MMYAIRKSFEKGCAECQEEWSRLLNAVLTTRIVCFQNHIKSRIPQCKYFFPNTTKIHLNKQRKRFRINSQQIFELCHGKWSDFVVPNITVKTSLHKNLTFYVSTNLRGEHFLLTVSLKKLVSFCHQTQARTHYLKI